MLVLVGLGNPGEKHAKQRHNVGFMAVDAIAEANSFEPPRVKFHGLIQEGFLDTDRGRQKVLILKPQTFMNESGRSVQELAQFYKLEPEDFIVFYDELDLAPGKVKMKTGGGHAGHNGIRSIDSHLGNNFVRIRIGIGHPGDKSKVLGHVLGSFSKNDEDWLWPSLNAIACSAPKLTDSAAAFLTDYALRLNPPRKSKSPEAKPSQPKNDTDVKQKIQLPKKVAQPEKTQGPLSDALSKLFGQKD